MSTTHSKTGADESRKHALVADDDPFHRELAATALREAGFAVVEAGDGAQTLERFEDHQIDIAVVDLTMPLVDGFDVIARLRAASETRHVPLIVMTGQDDPASVKRAFDLGATSFLAKPVNWPLFVPHVEFVLRAARTEAELRDSSHAIEYLSRLKTSLLAVLANEFRVPLKTIYGFSELMRQEVEGPLGVPLYSEYVHDICKSVEQMNVLLLKMLHFGRVLCEQISLEEEEFRVGTSLGDAIESVTDRAERHGIEIESDLRAAARLVCYGDRSLLGQAFRSLIENAVKLSPRGGVVKVQALIDAEGRLVYSVQDSGPVLTPDQIHAILRSSGLGLGAVGANTERDVGLMVSRLLVEAHGGQLELIPRSGEGTLARIVLPRYRLDSIGHGPLAPTRAASAHREFALAAR